MSDLSLFDILRRHWLLSLLIVGAFLGLGLAYIQLAPKTYNATAEIIVQDPRAESLLNVASDAGGSTMSSERNLADQAQIIQSAQVANVASEILDNGMSADEILANRSVSGSATSNLIQVTFSASNPQLAKEAADALVEAYLEVRRDQVQSTAGVALARVDALQQRLDDDLDGINAQIRESVLNDESSRELNDQISRALENLNELRRQRAEAVPGSPERELINSQIDELMADFAGWQTILDVQRQDSELAQLFAQRDAAIAERAALTGRRNSIAVDAELAAGGVTLVSEASTPNQPAGISPELIIAATALLGLAVALIVSYYLTLKRRVIVDRSMPESIIGAPLLGVIPTFDTHNSVNQTSGPGADPLATEAFRFASAAIATRASLAGARSIFVSSAEPGAGTSTVTANTAVAAAISGHRVAVVDGDFANQRLSRLFGIAPSVGMTDVVLGGAKTKDALIHYSLGEDRSLAVLQRGQLPAEVSSLLNEEAAETMFRYLNDNFDLVIIDGPPLLRVAYAGTLARIAQVAILVVDHGSEIEALEDAADRLELIDTSTLGYVYNKAPVRMVGRHQGQAAGREPEESDEIAGATTQKPTQRPRTRRAASDCSHETTERIEIAGMSREVCSNCGRVSVGFVGEHASEEGVEAWADLSPSDK